MTSRRFQTRWQIHHRKRVADAPTRSAATSLWDRRLGAIRQLAEHTALAPAEDSTRTASYRPRLPQ
jgi:hypothetical protein